MLKTMVVGKKLDGVTQLTQQMVMSGDRIVLVDASTGQPPKKITTKMVNKDLHIFADGATDPSVILNDYASYEQTVQISGVDSSGAFANYSTTQAGSMELGAVSAAPVAAATPFMSTSAWWGVGILAVAGGVAAAAGGGGGGDSTTPTALPPVVDPTAPTAIITMSDVVLNTGETAVVTIVFSEAVTGFSNADITAPNGTLSTFSSSDDITWTAIFTPTTAIADTTNIITLASGSYASSATSKVGAAATSVNYEVDTTVSAPDPLTITITDDQSTVANIAGTTVEYTFTFSEPVVSFNTSGITVAHGTPGTLQQQSSTVYKMLVTPEAGFTGDMTVVVAAGAAETSTGNSSLASITSYQVVDMLAPTVVSVTLTDPALTIGETSAVTITFSEAVTGFDNTDVSLAGAKGTLSTLTSSDNIVWTGLFTPTTLTSDASNLIQILNTYTDTAGNAGELGISANFTIDTRVAPIAAPTFLLTSDVGTSTTDSITNVNGVTVTLATGISNWEYSLDGGTNWTTGSGTNFNLVENISYAAGQIQVRQTDSGSNVSTIATNTQMTIVDTVGPVLAITDNEPSITSNMDGSNADGTTDADGGDILYTFAFNESVKDFVVGDITVSAGATPGTFTKVSDTLYTLAVKPVADFTGDITVGVLTSTYSDIAGNTGNAGSDTSSVQAVDMKAPLADALITADTANKTITLTFDENVDAVNMPGAGNFTVSTGYKANAVAAVEVSNSTIILHMTNAFSQTGGVELLYTDLTTDLIAAVQDLAGNDATSFNRSIADTLDPNLVTIAVSDTQISSGETPTVTFTFSEAVLGFDLSDITADNGTLGTLASNTDGTVWTSIFTPTIGITDLLNTVHFSGGAAYTDQAGNAGAITASSDNYLVDTQAPTLVSSSATLATHQMTFNFNEALDAVNFAPSGMFSVTDGVTYVVGDPTALKQFSINAVSISGNSAVVSIDPSITSTVGTTWTLTYIDAPGNDTFALQDIYGSDVSSFTRTAVI